MKTENAHEKELVLTFFKKAFNTF